MVPNLGSKIAYREDSGYFDKLPNDDQDFFDSLITQAQADLRPDRIQLGIGVYLGEDGSCAPMTAIVRAEQMLMSYVFDKSYPPMTGDRAFCRALGREIFGVAFDSLQFAVCHTPGGSGALSVAAAVLAERAEPQSRLWLPNPTWPNHLPLVGRREWTIRTYDFCDASSGLFSIEMMMTALKDARRGDVVLLQPSGQNPTGIDPPDSDFLLLLNFLGDRGLFALIDTAYLGFGKGMDGDCARLRLAAEILPEFALAVSCSKTFAVYSDRVGAAFFKVRSSHLISRVLSACTRSVRQTYSMPPCHGSAVVCALLENPDLRQLWLNELELRRARLVIVRASFAKTLLDLGHGRVAQDIASQSGLFSSLNLGSDALGSLARQDGVYLGPSGRVNLSGLNSSNIGRAGVAISPWLPKGWDPAS